MNKQELFEKYHVNETHNVWNTGIDSWISVEIFRIMHDGRLPTGTDLSLKYVLDFADKFKDAKEAAKLHERDDFGSLYLTSKRMIYMFADDILKELNPPKIIAIGKQTFKDAADFIDQMSEVFSNFMSNVDALGFYTYPATGEFPLTEYEEGISYYYNTKGMNLADRWIARYAKIYDYYFPDATNDFKPRDCCYYKNF